MGNIKNFNFNKTDFKLSNSDFWDLFLATDDTSSYISSGVTSGSCFVVWYDFNNPNIYSTGTTSANTIYSLVSWTGATNTGYTATTIGITGIDNGLITFDKTSGDTSNIALLSALTGTTLVIPSGDTRLVLNRVTGTTGNYIYPIDIVTDTTFTFGNYASLCGGFYQGYYKLDGYSYEVLPIRENQAWSAEFWLNPNDSCSGYTDTTLNDTYPNNKGFFFYMGTRAENKFWNTFDGVDSGCTSGCTVPSGCTGSVSTWCTTVKETDIVLNGDYGVGIPLNPPLINIDLVTNGFLIYGRGTTGSSCTCSACCGPGDNLGNETICTYNGEPKVVVTHSQTKTNNTNPFLVYGRGTTGSSCTCSACCGPGDNLGNQTICTFSGFSKDQDTLDYKADIIDNALGFRIKDDGSIGYRLLTYTGQCITSTTGDTYVSGVTVEEAYSISGIVETNKWSYVVIRFVMPYKTDCELESTKARKGKLMFYVNGKLKFVVDEFDELIAKRLNDNYLKQVGVPFNFSLGGGSQGLIESQTFDGLDMADRGLPIEQNFAGTFIGGISQFKFNICDINYADIQYNYKTNAARYGINSFLITEDGDYLTQEDGYLIEL